MRLRFINEEVKGSNFEQGQLMFKFSCIRILYSPKILLFYPLGRYDALIPMQESSNNCKKVQEIIDNVSADVLKGLIKYHKDRMDKKFKEYDNEVKSYDKVKEMYSKEIMMI
jgi:hypothetical protein